MLLRLATKVDQDDETVRELQVVDFLHAHSFKDLQMTNTIMDTPKDIIKDESLNGYNLKQAIDEHGDPNTLTYENDMYEIS
ncbi:hypothetical protein BJV82DRAFT_669524 [Fennellomyces sp. T-0311]|nr:hypothetical protein BJV82DRAFT_669524 [Fennellomyces sp. T-0311]